MVVLKLGDEWELVDSWEGFDCQHIPSGMRVEIKQSAAEQSWPRESVKPSALRFQIKPRARGSTDIYIYAGHGGEGESADHHNSDQWRFFVAAEADLPKKESIGLNRLRERVGCPCTITRLCLKTPYS